jgi:hypothetical protein
MSLNQTLGLANQGDSDRAKLMPTNGKENSIFYLKLQWISAKDEKERKVLGEKIRQLLGDEVKSEK